MFFELKRKNNSIEMRANTGQLDSGTKIGGQVFAMCKSWKTTALVMIIVIMTLSLGALFVEVRTNIIRRTLDNLIYDNRNHYLPCDQLPLEAEVNQVFQEHQITVEAIKNVDPGLVGVEIDSTTCPGRADILIWYASHENRLEIERILGGDTFFGVPYRLRNQ